MEQNHSAQDSKEHRPQRQTGSGLGSVSTAVGLRGTLCLHRLGSATMIVLLGPGLAPGREALADGH